MYSRSRLAAAVISVLTLTGCASMRVNSYVERGVDFTQYRTYNWGPADALLTGDARLDNNPFFHERVQADVEKQLAMRGFEKTTSENPDLQIHYHASISQRVDVNDLDQGYGYCEAGNCRPYVYDAGTLVLDFVDVRTKTVVWRGWAEGSVDRVIDDQKWLEEAIDDAVTRILERLPRRL